MPSWSLKTFGLNVNRLRNKASLTQERFAELADISRRYVLFIESGQKSPSLETISRIQKVLKCSWDELMKGV